MVPMKSRMPGLTFELTPTVEAGSVSWGCDDGAAGAAPAYAACRSGSGVERGVRPHLADDAMAFMIGGALIVRPASAEGGAGAGTRRRGVGKGVARRGERERRFRFW